MSRARVCIGINLKKYLGGEGLTKAKWQNPWWELLEGGGGGGEVITKLTHFYLKKPRL